MVKLLRDYTSKEVVSRQRNASSSEARGESAEAELQAPELPPNKICEEKNTVPKDLPKSAKLIFANKKERDIMYREELEHLSRATRER